MADRNLAERRVAAAWHGMVTLGGLSAADRVLVLDAGRAENGAAMVVAGHHGAEVISHFLHEDERAVATDQNGVVAGAEELRDALFAATDNQPVTMVVDGTGGELVRPALRCLKWLGTYVSLAGEDATVPANYPLIKGLTVIGVDEDAMFAAPSAAEEASIRAAAAI